MDNEQAELTRFPFFPSCRNPWDCRFFILR
jgi:hypothetical protein